MPPDETEDGAVRDTAIGGSGRFEYDPPVLRWGEGSVAGLEEELEDHGVDRALVVCGQTVGHTSAVIDPVTEGLGHRAAGVFAETTPRKRLSTALAAADQYRDQNCDGIVALGGGSSLDVAKAASVVAVDDRDPGTIADEFEARGTLTTRDATPPIFAVPTTLAGADCSSVAGLTADPADDPVSTPVSGGLGHPDLMPAAVWYDPALLATTPRTVLAGSAMNGFDKGIETLYARNRTPVTDATALRGLEQFQSGLLAYGRGDESDDTYESLARGVMLVQYGIGRPGETTLSLIHAFGHGLTRTSPLQQGAAHAIVAPHALRYLFERVDGRRHTLAKALGVVPSNSETATHSTDEDREAARIVDAVTEIRDALDLPSQLRDVDGPTRDELSEVAQAVKRDAFLSNGPPELDPTVDELEDVLERAW